MPTRRACARCAIVCGRALSTVDGIHLNGPMEPRLPNNLNVRVDGVHGESLLKAIAGDVAVSSGAACATASAEPSHVLRAMGLSDEEARASIRFGLGRFNDRAGDRRCRGDRRGRSQTSAALGPDSGSVLHGYIRRHGGSGERREPVCGLHDDLGILEREQQGAR